EVAGRRPSRALYHSGSSLLARITGRGLREDLKGALVLDCRVGGRHLPRRRYVILPAGRDREPIRLASLGVEAEAVVAGMGRSRNRYKDWTRTNWRSEAFLAF